MILAPHPSDAGVAARPSPPLLHSPESARPAGSGKGGYPSRQDRRHLGGPQVRGHAPDTNLARLIEDRRLPSHPASRGRRPSASTAGEADHAALPISDQTRCRHQEGANHCFDSPMSGSGLCRSPAPRGPEGPTILRAARSDTWGSRNPGIRPGMDPGEGERTAPTPRLVQHPMGRPPAMGAMVGARRTASPRAQTPAWEP